MTHLKIEDLNFEYSDLFLEILQQENVSLLVSTYQASKVIVVGSTSDSLAVSNIEVARPMGIAIRKITPNQASSQIAIGANRNIDFWEQPAADKRYCTRHDLSQHDAVFVQTESMPTGDVQIHELGWAGNDFWFVNTRFSALCRPSNQSSFAAKWRPSFISSLSDDDRCHLNGLEFADNQPKFATALATTDAGGAWRDHKLEGGVVIDIPSNEIVCDRLCLPHSPRIKNDQNWVLNSGLGEVGTFDPLSREFESVEFMPGFLRGMSFSGRYAFVGLSKARETNVFGGLPILKRAPDVKCGVGIMDLQSGKTVAVLKFESVVSEIFAVEVVSGCRNPFFAGSRQGGESRELWVVEE